MTATTTKTCNICDKPESADSPLVFMAGFSDMRESRGWVSPDQWLCEVCHWHETSDYFAWADDAVT